MAPKASPLHHDKRFNNTSQGPTGRGEGRVLQDLTHHVPPMTTRATGPTAWADDTTIDLCDLNPSAAVHCGTVLHNTEMFLHTLPVSSRRARMPSELMQLIRFPTWRLLHGGSTWQWAVGTRIHMNPTTTSGTLELPPHAHTRGAMCLAIVQTPLAQDRVLLSTARARHEQ